MAETVDWNDENDPRVRQHRIRERRKQWELEETARTTGVGLLQGFTDEQLLDELERRHPEAKGYVAGSGSYRYNDPVDWTQTQGAGLTSDTSAFNPNLEPTRAHSITTTILQPGTLPSQHQANVLVDEARWEEQQRAAEAGQALPDSQGQQNAAAQVVEPS